jgi:integrase
MRLTDKTVAALPPPATGNRRTSDSELPGFAVQVSAAGHRAFVLRYRLHGRQHQMAVGAYPTWTTTAARRRAKELRRLVDQGIDPLADQAPVDTVAKVIAEFIARDQRPRNRHWQEVERILKRELAPWLDRPIQDITRRDVIERVDSIADRAPVRANRVLAWTRRLFGWALERDIIEASPVAGVKAPTREVARDRVLEPAELAAVWRASEALGWPFGSIIQLLALTGARKGEVVGMRWQDVDLERRIWIVPKELNKACRRHEVPLSDLAMEIIEGLPRLGDGLVFPARGTSSSKPVAGFSKIKTRLDAHIARQRAEQRLGRHLNDDESPASTDYLAPWRIHDLRRTAASGMARLGHPPHVVAAVLNHSPGSTQGITAVYNRHRYTDEKRAALDAWSREIERLIGRGEAKVVTLSRTG